MTKPTPPTNNAPTKATASSAPPTTLRMPENCVNVTPQKLDMTFGIVGATSPK